MLRSRLIAGVSIGRGRSPKACTWSLAVATLGLCLASVGPALAQGSGSSGTDCQGLRQQLAGHARLSEGVRRAVATQASATVAAGPVKPSTLPSTDRAAAIRTRLEQIPGERQTLEDQRLAAMVKFELSRAGQIQGQIQTLDAEKSDLEREQASLKPAPAALPAATSQAPPSDVARIRCQDLPATVASAVTTRRRELGAGEDQAGAIPLIGVEGQTAEQIGGELARQLDSGAAATPQVGLLDADGNGRLDGFVDVPAPGTFRLVRQRTDGTVKIETFSAPGSPATSTYGELTRRLDEATISHARQSLPELLAIRPAGPLRGVTQTAEFAQAYAQFQAGNFAEAARLGAPAARSMEYDNLRGQTVRMLEIVSPVSGGVSLRRAVVLTQPNDRLLWEETTAVVRPTSYWRTDVELTRRQETRTASGTVLGTPSTPASSTFALER